MIPTRLRRGLLAVAILVLASTQPQITPGGQGLQPSASSGATAPAPEHPLHALPYTPSLDLDSMDRGADPCVDFYQFVCGGWMKNNPIPPDQPSWSVYAKLAEENEQFLWGILQEASDASRARNASQQKIGDFFEACMDESAIENLGAAPLQTSLGEIAALKSKSELAKYLGQEHLALGGGGTLFGFGSGQDYADASQVIAFADAGGLGLPDRDYYIKTDPQSQQIRTQYLGHLQRMFKLLGDPSGAVAAEARTVMAMETALAQSSLTRVERREPHNLFHKMDRVQLKALTPDFDWDVYLAAQGRPDVQTFNVTEPKFYGEMDQLIQSTSLDDWKTYLRWHLAHAWAPYLSQRFQQENFDFYSHTLRGVDVMQPRWKRCVRWVDARLGGGAGAGVRGQNVRPRRQGPHREDDPRDRSGHGGRPEELAVDEPGNPAAGAGEAALHRQQDRLSRQVARLQHSRDRARRLCGQRAPQRHLRIQARTWRRSANPSIAASGK